jgi:hypothetical protein
MLRVGVMASINIYIIAVAFFLKLEIVVAFLKYAKIAMACI